MIYFDKTLDELYDILRDLNYSILPLRINYNVDQFVRENEFYFSIEFVPLLKYCIIRFGNIVVAHSVNDCRLDDESGEPEDISVFLKRWFNQYAKLFKQI